MTKFPHAHLVPRDLKGNLQWRRYVLKHAYESETYRAGLMELCKEDPLFFALTFLWLLEPRILKHNIGRDGQMDMPSTIPFLFWPMQEEAFEEMYDSLFGAEPRDCAIVKSRAVGASWLMLALFIWIWLFRPQSHLGLVSATEEKVDSPHDPDALMNKLDYFLEHLPYFMKPEYTRLQNSHTLKNLENGSSVVGYAATGEVARGGRKLAFGFDEMHSFKAGEDSLAMDSTQYVTNCRFFISTPSRRKGKSGTFWDIVNGAEHGANNTHLIKMEWWKIPHQRVGLYRWPKHGELEKLDRDFEWPDDYQFIQDGRLRSPWFDNEWLRGGNSPQKIAAELELDFGAAGATFFDSDAKAKAEATVDAPELVGRFMYDAETFLDGEFLHASGGDLRVWAKPRPRHQYTLGVDVAAGTGGSRSNYSAIVGFDRSTGEQVLEFACHTIKPDELADLAHALGLAYNMAKVNIETNGPSGQTCINRLVETCYRNLYYRKQEERAYTKRTEKPGYRNQDGGQRVLENLVAGVRRGECVLKSQRLVAELGQYIFVNGKLTHSSTQTKEDEANAGTSHGDCAIAGAIGYFTLTDSPKYEIKEEKKEHLPEYSLMARRKLHRQRQASASQGNWGL